MSVVAFSSTSAFNSTYLPAMTSLSFCRSSLGSTPPPGFSSIYNLSGGGLRFGPPSFFCSFGDFTNISFSVCYGFGRSNLTCRCLTAAAASFGSWRCRAFITMFASFNFFLTSASVEELIIAFNRACSLANSNDIFSVDGAKTDTSCAY